MPGFLIPLVLGGASALTNLFGAKKQSDAAKEASAIQANAAQMATQLQREQFQQTQANLTPYMQAGAGGLTALTSLLGVAPSMAAGAPVNARPPGVPAGATWAIDRPAGSVPIRGGPVIDAPPTLTPEQRGPRARGGTAYAAPGGLVTLRAPTGQTQAVPAEQVDFFLARGATRV